MSVPANQMPPPNQAPAPAGPATPSPNGAPAPGGDDPGARQKAALDTFRQLAPEIKVVVKECIEVINKNGEAMIEKVMQGAGSVAIGLSQAALALITGVCRKLEAEATEATGQDVKIDLNRLVGDAGPGELILAVLFGKAEQMGVEGATDESEYIVAGDALDVLLEMTEKAGTGATQGEDGGDPEAAGAAPPQGAPPPQEAPPPGGGWRKPA